jgi:succinate dehydrogenase hydrophobic anchor subunit
LAAARLLRAAASAVVLLIVVAIVLFDLKANGSNSVVKAIHDGANFFASPFTDLFHTHGVRKSLTINWGIAAVVYAIAGAIVAAIIASPARVLRPFRR